MTGITRLPVEHPRITRVQVVRCPATRKHPRAVVAAGGVAATDGAKRRAKCTRGLRQHPSTSVSAECSGYVWRYSPHRGVTFAVHHACADIANDTHGYELWTSGVELAGKARCSSKAVYEALATLEAYGDLVELESARDRNGKPTGKPVRYRFMMPTRDAVWLPKSLRDVTPQVPPPCPQRDTPGATGVAREVPRGDTPGATNVSNSSDEHNGAPSDDVAHEIATTFYEFVKAKTDGIAPKFLGVRSAVKGALGQGCTRIDVERALSTLWRERQITAPSTAIIVETVVRNRVTAPEMPAAMHDDVRRCYRDDCSAPVVGAICIEDHEQPGDELTITIETEQHE